MTKYEMNPRIKQTEDKDAAAHNQVQKPAYREAANDPVKFLTETELAQRWNVSAKHLQKWRTYGGGVTYHKFGSAVRYSVLDIEEFEAQASRRNTSEGGENE